MDIHISIIIVSFNTAELLEKCIGSLFDDPTSPSFEVTVVDNNSCDGSVEMLRSRFPQVKIIANTRNAGFAAANNQGIESASGDYLFFLNPDTLVRPGCLKILHDYMTSHPDTGICGPHTWLDEEQTLEICSLKILTPERARSVFTRYPYRHRETILSRIWQIDSGLWTSKTACEVEGIGGAAMFLERKRMLSMGGFDERFFMGYEDTDLCAMIRKQRLSIRVIPGAHIIHLFGQSKRHIQAPARNIYSWQTAPMLFLEKHFGPSASKKFLRQKRLDAIWRRLFPTPVYGHSSQRNSNGIQLQWSTRKPGPYILEISNDHIFYDKFANVTHQENYLVKNTVMKRLDSTIWYWRTWDISGSSPESPIVQGHWREPQ